MRTAALIAALGLLHAGAAHAQAPDVQTLIGPGAGSQPVRMAFPDVLATVKGAPRFKIEARLQLLRAKLKPTDVTCTARRFSPAWVRLGGTAFAPYTCTLGSKTLFITARQTYYDAAGRRLAPSDPDLPAKAARLGQTNFKWRWT